MLKHQIGGGKTKRHLISHFLSNTSGKNYRSRIVYVKIMSSQRWAFLKHSIVSKKVALKRITLNVTSTKFKLLPKYLE